MIRIDMLPGKNTGPAGGLARNMRVAIGTLLPAMRWERLVIEPVSETVVLTGKPFRIGGVSIRFACSVSAADEAPCLRILNGEKEP